MLVNPLELFSCFCPHLVRGFFLHLQVKNLERTLDSAGNDCTFRRTLLFAGGRLSDSSDNALPCIHCGSG